MLFRSVGDVTAPEGAAWPLVPPSTYGPPPFQGRGISLDPDPPCSPRPWTLGAENSLRVRLLGNHTLTGHTSPADSTNNHLHRPTRQHHRFCSADLTLVAFSSALSTKVTRIGTLQRIHDQSLPGAVKLRRWWGGGPSARAQHAPSLRSHGVLTIPTTRMMAEQIEIRVRLNKKPVTSMSEESSVRSVAAARRALLWMGTHRTRSREHQALFLEI